MKRNILFIAFALFTAVWFVLAGCGGSESESEDNGAVKEPVAVAETVEQAIEEKIAEAVDTGAGADQLVGEWVDISDAERFIKITKEGSEYTYEDNEGKLPASFNEGVLKIKVSDSDTADVYLDSNSGNLFLSYLDNLSEYAKKQ